MTRVLHTGDTHLGYRQYHRPERQSDFLEAFRRVAEDAVELDVDAVVHAGDLFHDRRPGLSDLLGTLDVLETLEEADVPFLAVVGNHETKRDAQWLDLFEAMGLATRLGAEPVVVGDTAFYGLDFVPRAKRDDLEYEFDTHDADHAALVSHGLFAPLVPDYGNVEWDAAEVLAESNVDFDAMLLGDEHAPTTQEVDGTWVTYCGSTERASASERDERGYNLVSFDGDAQITRRGLETREFVFVDLELAEDEGFDRVRERLREYDLADAVVHVSLEGTGEDVSAARIESFASDEGSLVARVTDRREVDDETDLEVSFADPDEAVRERVRELGLSDAARDLDETIRASKVADSNVADEVERRVDELLEEPTAFESSPPEAPETVADRMDGGSNEGAAEKEPATGSGPTGELAGDSETDAAASGGGSDVSEGDDASGEPVEELAEEPAKSSAEESTEGPTEGSVDEPSDGPADESEEQVSAGEQDSTRDDRHQGDQSDEGSEQDQPDAEPTPPASAGEGDGDGQASMEDYL